MLAYATFMSGRGVWLAAISTSIVGAAVLYLVSRSIGAVTLAGLLAVPIYIIAFRLSARLARKFAVEREQSLHNLLDIRDEDPVRDED